MALITNAKEIRYFSPTSKWSENEVADLLPLIEEEEEIVLGNILGTELYLQILDDYNANETDPFKQKIINTCQRVVFYRMLANNSGIFSVSFNRGGGLSMMSTDSYEAADKEAVKRFERDAWRKSERNIENLLAYLEEDAKADKIYTELWENSKYFYFHSKLLFKTSHDLQKFLHLPTQEPRGMFISLVPAIDLCQDTYIIPRVGNDVFAKLLDGSYKNEEKSSEWENIYLHVCRSLANYVANETASLKTEKSLMHADMQIALAEKILSGLSPKEEEPVSPTPSKPRRPKYDVDDPSNAILDIGGLFHSS